MVDPVFGSILGKRDVRSIVRVGSIVQTEQDAQAGLSEDGVRRLEVNAMPRDIAIFRVREPLQGQKFFDSEVRKLDHSAVAIMIIDDGNQTGSGARRQHCLVLIHPSPIRVQLRVDSFVAFHVEVDCKDLREFLDTKWPDGNGEAL